ncbi:MAG: hypothetical protein AMJ75_12695 [Phycisphaerae bacterium SM1_79]|nr:MAG: hypothetical protein AMJ75_12695 [Phycisphaerae bacterium SM1_79]
MIVAGALAVMQGKPAVVPLTTVAVILVALTPVVIRDKTAAVLVVAVTNVAAAPAVIPVKPAAVQYVALVVVAVWGEDAVATSGKSAVTVGIATILPRKNVVETEMVLYVIRRGGNAVMRPDV